MEFFDASTKRCLLCDLPITTTNQAHIGRHEHQARLGVLERSLALIHALVLDVQRRNSVPGGGGRRRHTAAAAVAELAGSVRGEEKKMVFKQPRDAENLLGVQDHLLLQDAVALQKIQFKDILIEKWWRSLDYSYDLNAVSGVTAPNSYNRLSHLSSSSSKERRWRLRYMLDWLKYNGVLQSSLSIANATISPEAFSRSQRFEVLEMVGDCVVKVELPDRLTRLFPHGVCSKLALFQRLIDSNSGLLDIYDWLKLDQIIGAKLANSKAKADVVECIFGELQCFLWATEINADPVNTYNAHPGKEFQYIRAVVQHTMHELMHAVFMWRLETTMESAGEFIQGHALELKRHRGGTAAGNGTHGRKRVPEKDLDRGRYATLPLLTIEARPHAMGSLSSGELWYHSTHAAVTRAGPHQTAFSFLSETPMPKPALMVQRLEAGAVSRAKDPLVFQEKVAAAKAALASEQQRQQTSADGLSSCSSIFPASKNGLLFSAWGADERKSAERHQLYEQTREFLLSEEDIQKITRKGLIAFVNNGLPSLKVSETSHVLPMPDFLNSQRSADGRVKEEVVPVSALKELQKGILSHFGKGVRQHHTCNG